MVAILYRLSNTRDQQTHRKTAQVVINFVPSFGSGFVVHRRIARFKFALFAKTQLGNKVDYVNNTLPIFKLK